MQGCDVFKEKLLNLLLCVLTWRITHLCREGVTEEPDFAAAELMLKSATRGWD